MLSIFPSLLSYQELSPLLIRLVLGLTIAYFGYRRIVGRGTGLCKKSIICGYIEVLVAIFILIGLYTQLAALIIAVYLVIELVMKARDKELLTDGINYYILLLVMAISLMVTNAGWWAFDLPL